MCHLDVRLPTTKRLCDATINCDWQLQQLLVRFRGIIKQVCQNYCKQANLKNMYVCCLLSYMFQAGQVGKKIFTHCSKKNAQFFLEKMAKKSWCKVKGGLVNNTKLFLWPAYLIARQTCRSEQAVQN